MRNYFGYIIDYSDRKLTDRKRKWFESELVRNSMLREEFNFFNKVNSTMRGKYDLDEIQKDPELKETDILAHQMVSAFHRNPEKYASSKTFIENSLAENQIDAVLQNKLNQIADEIKEHHVNDITKGWVSEWNTNNQRQDAESVERRSFVNLALEDNTEQEQFHKTKLKKHLAIRIAGFAAAAIIGAFFVIGSLAPSNNPENIYQEFYKPLNAYTSITRSSENIVDPFSNAVEKYKKGQYQVAVVMFSDLIFEDSSNISYHFFSGICQLELSNYEQSIELLSKVVANKGEFQKEAKWFLSLAYIKTNNNQMAANLLNELSIEKGYYQSRAQKLLERIK